MKGTQTLAGFKRNNHIVGRIARQRRKHLFAAVAHAHVAHNVATALCHARGFSRTHLPTL